MGTYSYEDLAADPSPVVTVTDVAELLGLDTRTVARACERGELPSIQVGRRRLVVRERLLSMLGGPDSASEVSPGISVDASPRNDAP